MLRRGQRHGRDRLLVAQPHGRPARQQVASTEFRTDQGTNDREVVEPQTEGPATAQYPIDAEQEDIIENTEERGAGR